jgi:DNA-binding transcriptional ArsR family regulator
VGLGLLTTLAKQQEALSFHLKRASSLEETKLTEEEQERRDIMQIIIKTVIQTYSPQYLDLTNQAHLSHIKSKSKAG